MTLIVALQARDGLVLASDSRGTIGDPRALTAISDTQTKLFKLSQYCGIGISGSSELAAKLVDELKARLTERNKVLTDEILEETRELARERFDDWFDKFALEKRPTLLILLVGYQVTDAGAIPRTYLLNSRLDFAPQLFPHGNCLAGIPQYATYLMHRLYNPEMTVNNLVRLAAYLIAETATQDPKVGGPIHIAKIPTGGPFHELSANEVNQIIALNEQQTEKLKQFFFGGGEHGGR